MWKILVFLEKWVMYPVIFTLCFTIYYIMYVIMTFELPHDMNYVKMYKNNHHKDMSMGDFAHGLSALLACIILVGLVFELIYTHTHSDHIISRNVCR
jgi:hypothetical protein